MMYRGLTLLLVLAAVVFTDMARAGDSSGSCAGHVRVPARGDGLGVTRFVCAHCTATGQLSSRCLFLNRAAVRRHISASKPCFTAGMGFREIAVEALPGESIAGGGGGAGPAPDVRHPTQKVAAINRQLRMSSIENSPVRAPPE